MGEITGQRVSLHVKHLHGYPTENVRADEIRPGDTILIDDDVKVVVAKVRTRRRLDIPPTPETRITVFYGFLGVKSQLTDRWHPPSWQVERVIQ